MNEQILGLDKSRRRQKLIDNLHFWIKHYCFFQNKIWNGYSNGKFEIENSIYNIEKNLKKLGVN